MKNSRNLIILALIAVVALVFYWYRMPRFRAGESAPDFEVTLIDGQRAKLSDLRGKYVLLQFWGSWCGPCRHENHELVQLYQKYHDKGFEIFSIALDQNPRAWQAAILHDGMLWRYHTLESADFKGARAKQFNVHAIPTTFLVNKDGVIMGVDLKPEFIDRMLAEKIGG